MFQPLQNHRGDVMPEWAGHIYYTGARRACVYHTITDLYTHEGTSPSLKGNVETSRGQRVRAHLHRRSVAMLATV